MKTAASLAISNVTPGTLRTAEAQAIADPIFEIDPSFPDAGLYQIVYSANIPEPSSLVCVTGVVACVAGGMRRRSGRNG